MRAVSNFNDGYPHMRGNVSHHAATVAEVLRDEGYTTFCVGKWHLCQMEDASAAGPYDQWPCQRGFDRFYGFLEGETDQFNPELVYDNHQVDPPRTVAEGYHLSEDLIDKARLFIHDTKSIRPDRPFFTYLAFGATHAPHQAPPEYLEKYKGRYDEGWDVARERWFAKQLADGLLPPDTQLAPRNPGVEAWDSLSDNEKRLAARMQEAYAAFLDHTDVQIGRFLDDLEALGELDNTLIFLMSDNGASQEGGPFGVLHEMKFFNFLIETPDQAIHRIDEIGGPSSHCNYPWGWAQAGNTPFKWYKQNTHEGGVHVPLVVRFPGAIPDPGGTRDQFHHVSDITPTIYEVLGISPPDVYRGYEQMPVTGTSMRYTFANPDESTHNDRQVFECMGHRAIVDKGWKAVTHHQFGSPFEDDRWELYHVDEDRSECNDLAEAEPQKLKEMIELWWEEAEASGILPLDDRTIELFGARFRDHSPHPTSRHYRYVPPMSPLPAQAAAAIGGRSWELTARVDRPAGAGGVLYALGTENSGLSLFVKDDHLVFDYNEFGTHHILRSDAPVPMGASELGVRFTRLGDPGEATLVVDGTDNGTISLPFAMRVISSVGPSVGYDHGSPVSREYEGPFAFEGTLHSVDIQLAGGREADDTALVDERATMGQQ
jgi:arylsulfatase